MHETISITVVFSKHARAYEMVELQLAVGATVQQALQSSRLLQNEESHAMEALAVGIWGSKATLQTVLRAHDRVELTRPLTVDPKVARRERFTKQGARSAGLFKQKRPGAKSGY